MQPDHLGGALCLTHNEHIVAAGPLTALSGLPEQLSWLARAVGGLRAGHVVFFGSPTAAIHATPGKIEARGLNAPPLSVEFLP